MSLSGLPEASWAVMSALYVIRPGAGGTLGSLGSRAGATVLGSVTGLVLLHALGQGPWQTLLARQARPPARRARRWTGRSGSGSGRGCSP